MRGIIDTHVHLSERRDDALVPFAQMNGLRYTLKELLGIMQELKIETSLLLSPPLRDRRILPNNEIIALCKKSKGKLRPVITVEPTTSEVKTALRLTEKNRSDVKAFKIRLGYIKTQVENPLFDAVYDYAEAEGLPVLFHTGDTAFSNGDLAKAHPLTLDRLANEREELTIVLCHFGNPWFEDVAELIYKHPNVYADLSGLTTGGAYAEKYAKLIARRISEAVYFAAGAGKILFGTDYPVTKHSDALALVKSLDIDERDKKKILWGNAERVFRL